MKPAYSDLIYQKVIHSAGLWKMVIIPREWILDDLLIDFETGRVMDIPAIDGTKFWLQLECTDLSYEYAENPKKTKSGDYYEVNISGSLNTFDFGLQRVLETVRMSELVVIMTDRNKRRKIIGSRENGMALKITHVVKNASHSQEELQLDLTGMFEELPPFYNPDNAPETGGNFLIDSDGNYLFVV
jgi:hypothetical protein